MKSPAQVHAEAVRTALLDRRRAEVDELFHLTELALAYGVGEPEESLEVWSEHRRRFGAAGTPLISEFVAMEIAGLLGCSVAAAASRLAGALNLRWRHPSMWESVQCVQLDVGRALKAATACSDLPQDLAEEVGRQWAAAQCRLGWRAAFNLLEEMIVAADPAAAAVRAGKAAKGRHVSLGESADGNTYLDATLAPVDALLLNSTLNELADILADGGVEVTSTHQQLRAKALGILAVPALALRLQQQAIQTPLPLDEDTRPTRTDGAVAPATVQDPFGLTQSELEELYARDDATWDAAHPWEPDTLDHFLTRMDEADAALSGGALDAHRFLWGPGSGRAAATGMAESVGVTPGRCLGHRCGRIDVPTAKLLPKVRVVIHVDAAEVEAYNDGSLEGTAWIEHVGTVTLASLSRMLDGKQVVAQPVLDLNTIPVEDRYRPSARMAEAVTQLFPYEAFPYSTRRSRAADLDHTIAYRPSNGPGQTRLGNLAPLTRTTHRAKTLGAWRCRQPSPGTLHWTSPLGYRYEVTTNGTSAFN